MANELKDKTGTVIRRDGEVVWCSSMLDAVIKGVDTDKRLMWITGSTEARDRDGDMITLSGWEMANYLKNPVFMWAHDYSSVPIGGAKRLVRRKEPKRLDFLIHFPDMKDLWTFPELIMQMYADGKISASSVGFLPRKQEPLEKDPNDDAMAWSGRRFLKQELLELSGCAVPSNPEALANSFKGYGRFESMPKARQDRLLAYLIDGSSPERVEEAKQVIEHECTKCEFVDETEPKKVFVSVQLEEKPPAKTWEDVTEDDIISLVKLGLEANPAFRSMFEETFAVEPEGKIGAVLNRKNKEMLQTAADNILQVLKSAGPEEENATPTTEPGKVVDHFEYLLAAEPSTKTSKPNGNGRYWSGMQNGQSDTSRESARKGKDRTQQQVPVTEISKDEVTQIKSLIEASRALMQVVSIDTKQ